MRVAPITYSQIHEIEEATKMNIHHQLGLIGADEYNFTYQPFAGPDCGWSLRFHSTAGRYIEVCGVTLQVCIDKAITESRSMTLLEGLKQFTAQVAETFSEPTFGVREIGGEKVIGVGLYDTFQRFTFMEIDSETSLAEAIDAIKASLPEWGFS